MFLKVRNYLAPNFTIENFRIQVRGPPASNVYGSHITPVTRGDLGYVSYHRYASRKDPDLCSRIVFRAVLSLYVSTQTIFLYYKSVKYTLRGYFWCFRCPCYALFVMSNRWNQYNFSTLRRLSIWRHRWILILLLIFIDWYKHSNTNVAGSKCILNRLWCIIWRPKGIFDQNVHIT